MPVTLRDVARAAGVSTASASRAIVRPEAVSQELRARILAAAGRLGYSPNLAARALVARRSGLVAMLVDAPIEPLRAAALAAIERELAHAGYALLVAAAQGPEDALARSGDLLGRGVEGVICWSAADTDALRARAESRSVPWVVFDHPATGGLAFAASSGRLRGSVLASRYLLSLGHRRFATLAAPASGIGEAVREVLAGTSATLRESPSAAVRGDLDRAQAAVGALLDGGEPTAILCDDDLLAMAALRECAGRGLSVPGEISVVGFGDSPLARCSSPPLTSVRVAAEEIGARAAEALLLMLAGGVPSPAEVSLKLVIRESTGPAPA